MNYRVINLMTGEVWEGQAPSAKDVYEQIAIKKGDTTVLKYGRQTSVREW